MLKHTMLALSALVVGLVNGSSAYGALWGDIVSGPNVPAGYVANELLWTGPSDWTSAAIVVDLTSGSVYNNANGGDAAPSSAFIGFVPELEFDTYVGIIDDGSAGIAGGAGDIGGGPKSLDAPQISVSWFNTRSTDTDLVRIGMITLSDDAQGTWIAISQGVVVSGTVTNGWLWPEPTSFALVCLGGIALLRRR